MEKLEIAVGIILFSSLMGGIIRAVYRKKKLDREAFRPSTYKPRFRRNSQDKVYREKRG